MSLNDLYAFSNRRSIRYPLARLIVAAFLAGLGLTLVSNALLMLDNVRMDIRRSLTAAANAAGTAAGAAVVFNDAKAARDVLNMYKVYPEIEAAALYTSQGSRLASYGKADLLPPDSGHVAAANKDIGLLAATTTVAVPIEIGGNRVGTVVLRARLKRYWHTYLSFIANTFLISLIVGALALVLVMRFLDKIIRPIRQLAESANDARLRQVFAPRDIPAAEDEIGELVRTFNALLQEVGESRRVQQFHQQELERQVLSRTAELLAAKTQADQANQAKTRFLAAASHDLRQPIHALRLFADALKGTPLDAEQGRIAGYMSLSLQSLTDILDALLDVSRLDSGMIRPNRAVVPVYELARNVEAEFAPLALAKGLGFKLYLPKREVVLYTDPKLLYSLLRNIIDNAIKYTADGGVLIGFRCRPDRTLIQVWDTGIGIEPGHIDHVFDEYFQVDNPQRNRAQGLGLGLAIAKRMADILGIRLTCRSRPGKGSIFEVSVPQAEIPASRPAAGDSAGQPVASRSLAGRRVVVVEDDAAVAAALELSLDRCGGSVSRYQDAERALAAPAIDKADFYIVDFRLPGMNGRQFLDEVQRRVGYPLNAVIVTGESSCAKDSAVATGPWRVLLKPVDLSMLIRIYESHQ